LPPPEPLKGSRRFEQKPKRVIKADDFSDQCGVEHDARLLIELNEILDCIHNGWEIPDRYYPRDVDRHGDRLLDELGVKHLHLGGRGSDIIVYLAEFDAWVELLEINTHVHLESEPRGKDLKGLFRVAAAATVGAAAGAAAETVIRKRRRRRRRKPQGKKPS
jgi:hypothetical protein